MYNQDKKEQLNESLLGSDDNQSDNRRLQEVGLGEDSYLGVQETESEQIVRAASIHSS